MKNQPKQKSLTSCMGLAVFTLICLLAGCGDSNVVSPANNTVNYEPQAKGDMQKACNSLEVLEQVPGVRVHEVSNGPAFPGGTKFVASADDKPGYCQVTGSFVTNPETGKTANFIATFPENWNGKYLQLGCSGVCGYLRMNDPAAPSITITAQGYPGQLIEKGYAIFGNDLGHQLNTHISNDVSWMFGEDGNIDEDSLTDYLYRADKVLAEKGKLMTLAFYAYLSKAKPEIDKSYFSGCSQGGRNALVAATRFPEKFDGIIAGSPAQDLQGLMMHTPAFGKIAQQPGVSPLNDTQKAWLNEQIMAKCDVADGIADGLIQNPAACDFDIGKDLAVCSDNTADDQCLTKLQANLVSAYFSGITNFEGENRLPGLPLMKSGYGFVAPIPADYPLDAHIRQVVGTEFDDQVITGAYVGADHQVTSYHGTVNEAAYKQYKEIMRTGTIDVEDFDISLKSDLKILWYHNLSDEILTPYMSVNRYKQLASRHGGYDVLQQDIRLFLMPGTGHCGYGGDGPANFDAISALEQWVENGKAPNSLIAGALDPALNDIIKGKVDPSKTTRTMPLCMFPQMAKYNGKGNILEAESWSCIATDQRMLELGVAGRQAGVDIN
ncbi:feruloyl esterase (plasmid) [Alteromonas sp. I4]|nr:feruloyl esterase [Alteromonas sp. I4]